MDEIRLTSWYGNYPIIYRVWYIPGGAGFLPSTVSSAFLRLVILLKTSPNWKRKANYGGKQAFHDGMNRHLVWAMPASRVMRLQLCQWLGTLVINPIVGVYMPIMRIPRFPIKGGMRSSPKIGSLDPGTYECIPVEYLAVWDVTQIRQDLGTNLVISNKIWQLCQRLGWRGMRGREEEEEKYPQRRDDERHPPAA